MDDKQIMAARFAARGFTLIELMISVVIACTVVAAALTLYAQGRATYRVNERIARLQEQGRFALSVIEPDIELAGYYGFTNAADSIRFVRGVSPDQILATAVQMRQGPLRTGDSPPPAVSALPAGAHVCGVNFAVDVMTPVQGSNDVFGMGRGRAAGCNPYQGRAQPGADTLTLRRVETQTSGAEAARLQIYASRLASRTSQLLFADGKSPGVSDDNHRVHNVVVRTFYVAQDSVGQRGFPALRVKSLTRFGSSLSFDEDEVMPGVEDLQVQFAVDIGGGATRYVNPDFVDLPRVQVAAVRVWLRLRADEPEVGVVDEQTYRYASVAYKPTGAERNFRRVLMSRTVAVRNARSGY